MAATKFAGSMTGRYAEPSAITAGFRGGPDDVVPEDAGGAAETAADEAFAALGRAMVGAALGAEELVALPQPTPSVAISTRAAVTLASGRGRRVVMFMAAPFRVRKPA